jgi:hypothetical protein
MKKCKQCDNSCKNELTHCSNVCKFKTIWNRNRERVANGEPIDVQTIKKLFRMDVDIHWCELCGLKDTWNGRPITLELDHINGDNKDNKYSNLRLLCPNCHSQTDTFKGRNKKNKPL